MKVLTYTSYKKYCDLYTEIYGSIAANGRKVGLAQKDIILLSKFSVTVYKAGKHTRVENTKFISFNLSAGTYSIDNFNAKIQVAILQQRQDWEPPIIKDLRLVIPKDYTFMADNTIFMHLSYKTTILRYSSRQINFTPLVLIEHPLIHHLLQKYCHCPISKSTKSKMS